MPGPIYSRCGMRCDLCLIYRPNVAKEDRRADVCAVWRKMFSGFDSNPAEVICDGCSCDREDAIVFTRDCKARACVIGKGIPHCGYCEQYPCAIFPAEPSAEELHQIIDVEHRWTWADERLMRAYDCKRYMDEFSMTNQKEPHHEIDHPRVQPE